MLHPQCYTQNVDISRMQSEMRGILNHDSVLQGYAGPGIVWANKMNSDMNHAPDAGSILHCKAILGRR